MGSETPLIMNNKLPVVDFSKEEILLPGTDNWVSVRAETFKAVLEEYGCFEAVYDKFPKELHNVIFGAQMEELFSLPLETKSRNAGEKVYHGYIGNRPHIPLHESMGINDVQIFERIQHFTNLMWPEGNHSFGENIQAYMNHVLDLTKMVTRMVFEGYGVEKYYDSHMESVTNLLRMLKYRAPHVDDETNIGANTHTDKSFISILHQNHVNGLEIQTKSGEWITATPSPNSFIVMIGDAFLAWSNGRLYSPPHRVTMSDGDARYSTALFTFSKDIVLVPEELVDEEHPLMFKPFDNIGYIDYYVKPGVPNADFTIKAYCGV